MSYVITWFGFAIGAAIYSLAIGFASNTDPVVGLYFSGAALFSHWVTWGRKTSLATKEN